LAYFPFEIPENKLPAFVEAVRFLPIAGFNITIPHKVAVLPFLDDLSPAVRAIGAVNTVLNQDGQLAGFNTDVDGFSGSVKKLFGENAWPKSAFILGSGGAARAVLYALLSSGTEAVWVANRNKARAQKLADDFQELFPGKKIVPGPLKMKFLVEAVRRAELIVQTTSVGMWPEVERILPFPFEALRLGQKIIDLIYNPRETRFLREARAHGAEGLNGLPMLIGQAARSLEIWGFPGKEKGLWEIARGMGEI
jgi:shikimate dehydrogenase